MNTKNLLRMAAVWMIGACMVACSGSDDITSNDTTEQPINKTVTLTGALTSDVTRTMNADGTTVWASGDSIAIYYKSGDGTYSWAIGLIKQATLNQSTSEFYATLNNPANLSEVYFVYPAPRKHIQQGTFKIESDDQAYQLTGIDKQLGTLADINKKWDLCVGKSKLDVVDYSASLENNAPVTMVNQLSIGKFELKDVEANTGITVKKLIVSDGTNTYTATPNTASSTYYVAMKPVTNQKFTFTAYTTNGRLYTKEFVNQTLGKGEFIDAGISMELAGVQLYANSPYWAVKNLGANTDTDYGLYFAWGATQGYDVDPSIDHFTRANSPYYTGDGENHSWSKYNASYDETTGTWTWDYDQLELEDDAAHVMWGGNWRMPTSQQMEDMVANTSREYYFEDNPTLTYTYHKYKGVAQGVMFIGQGDYSGNQIFLPAAGYTQSYDGTQINSKDSWCSYWLSTAIRTTSGGWNYNSPFSGNAVYADASGGNGRFMGRSIRAIWVP